MEKLLENLYSCIVDTRNWNVFCADLSRVFNSNSVAIISINEQSNQIINVSSSGLSDNSQQLLLSYLPNDDPRITISRNNCETSHVFNISSDESSLIDSNITHELLSPNKIFHHLVTCLNLNNREYVYVIICRQNQDIPFNAEDIKVLNDIKPHPLVQ